MQLEFSWREPRALLDELESRTGLRISMTVTDNSSSIMTFKGGRSGEPAQLRLHRMFLSAGPGVIDALSKWLVHRKNGRSATVLDKFIAGHGHLIRSRKQRPVRLTQAGRYFNLQSLYDEVNGRHFDGSVEAGITWGRVPSGKRRQSIRLGSYTPEDDLIRIHPYLDQSFVPEYFVRYVVFHEMLHAHLGVKESPSGRRCVHSPEFKRIERAYPDYKRAVVWHDNPKYLGRLLRAPRKKMTA